MKQSSKISSTSTSTGPRAKRNWKFVERKPAATWLKEDFNVNFTPLEDENDLQNSSIKEILEEMAKFTVHEQNERAKFVSDMIDVLFKTKLSDDLEKYLPENMDDFYSLGFYDQIDSPSTKQYKYAELLQNPSVFLSTIKIRVEVDRLWNNFMVENEIEIEDLNEDVRNVLGDLFELWSLKRYKDIGEEALLGVSHEREITKSMLAKIGALSQTSIRYKGSALFTLYHPNQGYEMKFKPDIVYMGTTQKDPSPLPRLVLEVFGDTNQQSRVNSIRQSVGDISEQQCPTQTSTSQKQNSIQDESSGDNLKSIDTHTRQKKKKKTSRKNDDLMEVHDITGQKLYMHHLGQLLACGQQIYPTFLRENLPESGKKDRLCVHGMYAVGGKIYFTKLEASAQYWQSCVCNRRIKQFGNFTADFSVSNWHLDLAFKNHFLSLIAFIKMYCSSPTNR